LSRYTNQCWIIWCR